MAATIALQASGEMPYPERYDVVWTTPSADSSGSMPTGNGEVGVNVWVEPKGDVVFYLARTDAWSENGRLLKLGRVRLRFTPAVFAGDSFVEQRLRLRTSEVEIRGGRGGDGHGEDRAARLVLRVDAHHPVVLVDFDSAAPATVTATLEVWRTGRRRLEEKELHSAYGLGRDNPEPVFVEPDVIVPAGTERVVWYHRNERSIWRANLELQGLGHLCETMRDPLLHRTFGGAIVGEGFRREDFDTLTSTEPRQHWSLAVHTLTGQTDTAERWRARLSNQIRGFTALDGARLLAAHRASWSSFWDRSWIEVEGFPEAEAVSRGYALHRYMLACAGRGSYPMKFNGSLFTVDARTSDGLFDADYRRWGGPYWWQNTRLAYWPMLAAGDFDRMRPLFRMYLDALSLARERTRIYYDHDGVFFPETIYFWGTYVNENYGWDRAGKPHGLTDNQYIRYYWQGGLELVLMMLEHASYAGDEPFLRTQVIPLAEAVLTFYDEHYGRDEAGRLRLEPAQALETYWDVPNPAPPIAGLRCVISRLLSLPRELASDAARERWERLLNELPPLPRREIDGEVVLSPAEEVRNKHNIENPELYAVFPYGLFGVGRDGLELARRTFAHRVHKDSPGWGQDAIQAACLGLADEAARQVVRRFTTSHEGSRFPAFWGPNYDWIPDLDHGGVAMIALQRMVLQADGRAMHLMTAWPAGWEARFRLHAPHATVVEGAFRGGRLEGLEVVPAERRGDVVGPAAR